MFRNKKILYEAVLTGIAQVSKNTNTKIKMAEDVITKKEILSIIARVAALSAMSYFTMKWLLDAIDPTRRQQIQAKERAQKLLKVRILLFLIHSKLCNTYISKYRA